MVKANIIQQISIFTFFLSAIIYTLQLSIDTNLMLLPCGGQFSVCTHLVTTPFHGYLFKDVSEAKTLRGESWYLPPGQKADLSTV